MLLLLATVCVLLFSPVSAHPGPIRVKSGQSIQAAINRADRGDRIVVEAGPYAEQLTIDKNGITLVSQGAILTPPAAFTPNTCSGLAGNDTAGNDSQAGICVTGAGVVLADFVTEHRKVLSVDKPVKDVSITGFEIHGFSGENIAVVGAKDARVTGNKLVDGGSYGALTVGSKGTRIARNTVTTTSLLFIGICMDDFGDVVVANNDISNYFIGLCIQTPGAEVRNNAVSNGCSGAFVDPFVDGAIVAKNHISATNNANCPENFAIGITIDGAVSTQVQNNIIENQRDAGIAVVDDLTTTPVAVSSHNRVVRNTLSGNGVDLFLNTTGTDNVFKHNGCGSTNPSFPVGLCT